MVAVPAREGSIILPMPLPQEPSLAVVVVVYAAGDAIARSIAAVRDDLSWLHHTVVLHNGTPHISLAELTALAPGCEVWASERNLGYAGAINYALDHADTDLVGIWNDDAAPRLGALGAMVDAFRPGSTEGERISAVTASIINQGEPEESCNGTLNLAGRIIPARFADRTHVLYPSGAAMLLRGDLPFLADPDYFLYYEDVYLGLTARLRGYRPVMAPEAKVDHLHHASMGSVNADELAFLRERNRLLTLWTIFSDETLPKLEAYWRQEEELLRLTALVGHGKAAAVAKAKAWMKEHEDEVRKKREAIQATRTVDDEALLAHFSYRLLSPSVPGATVFNRRAKRFCEENGLLTWDLREESKGRYPLPNLTGSFG